MSITTIVFVAESRMIDAQQWASALRTHGFEVDLDTDFDVRTFTGFLPCKYKGGDAGFEYYYDPVAGLGDLDARVRAATAGLDHAVSFVTHSDLRELMTSVLSACVLCAETGGVLWDTEGDELVLASDAIARARTAEREIASAIG